MRTTHPRCLWILPFLPCVIAACTKAESTTASKSEPAAQSAPAPTTGGAVAASAAVATPPPEAPAAREESAKMAVAGPVATATMAPRPGRAADDVPSPSPAFGVSPSFGGVKAGEWDDNANYREFQKFLSGTTVPFHNVNLANRRFLVVRDAKGLGIPRCKVTVTDGTQASASFVTTASGRAILFPHAEGLRTDKLTASADCAEGSVKTTFAMQDDQDGFVDLKLQADRRPITTKTIDLAFVLDTTGSMSEEIAAVKATIQKVAKVLSNEQTTVRIGLVEYKDRHDAFVTKVYPFSNDLPGFAQKVSEISASGGGDTPEDMNAGLNTALTKLQWSDQSVARMAFVIADAPPHLDYKDGPDYAVDMRKASHRGIQLFTVAASGMDLTGQVVFRQMAQFTGGTNMFVLRGGAGPQSTGGGDPASSCGDTHTNYSSGKLDELIVQKIRRELKFIDADPMRIAGLKTDENAKSCDQRIVWKD